MSTAPRRAEFFVLEANEYLADLEPLASAHDRPDAERLVRGARALRGAALMAGLGTFARAAAGLEAVARQVRDHALAWEPAAREAWMEGITELRGLVVRAATWEAVDDRRALALSERLEQVMSGRAARASVAPPEALTPGVRAFIARESALIAGSFEQASRALNPVPPATALAGVLERMRSLRGLGASAELSPLPELLDAMEVVTRGLLANVAAPPNIAGIFADASHALATMARAVADAGRILPPPELDSIAKRLLQAYASDSDVVPIVALAPDGLEAVVRAGEAPTAPADADPVPVELVSVGDHLLLAADSLAHPPSPAARDLRLFVLFQTLSAMPSRSATGRFLAPLAEAISAAIAAHVATERPEAFVAMLRGCGSFLVDAGGTTDQIAITRRRDAIATSLAMVAMGAPAGGFDVRPRAIAAEKPAQTPEPAPTPAILDAAELAPDEAEPEVMDIAALAPDEAEPEVMDIAALAPDEAEPEVMDIAALAPDEPEPAVMEIGELAPDEPEPAIMEITALAPDEPEPAVMAIGELAPDDLSDVVSIGSLAPPPAPTIPPAAPGEPSRLERAYLARRSRESAAPPVIPSLSGLIGIEIAPVEALLYRGDAALARTEEICREIGTILEEPDPSMDRIRRYVLELLDLVPLLRDAA